MKEGRSSRTKASGKKQWSEETVYQQRFIWEMDKDCLLETQESEDAQKCAKLEQKRVQILSRFSPTFCLMHKVKLQP